MKIGQKLTHFYSVDKWGKEKDPATKTHWGKSKSASKLTKHQSNQIDFDIVTTLRDLTLNL